MNSKELAGIVAEQARLTKKDAEIAVDAIFAAIGQAMTAGEEVRIPGFGIFGVKERAARSGVNPSTGAKIDIPATKAASFKASKNLKDAINK